MYNPSRAYLESKVLSASPLQLVHLAYEAAIAAIEDARQHLVEKRIRERSKAITKAQLILRHLESKLDIERGGELAVNLARLYTYMQKCLVEANAKQMEAPLIEAQRLLETLDESWQELATPETVKAAAASSAWSNSDDSGATNGRTRIQL